MRLLMITRKVDREDASPAGFTYNWVRKIGEKLEKLYVITWQESDRGRLPDNIKIISLSGNKFIKIFTIQWQLLRVLPKVNGVFCHQNPEYTILVFPIAKLFGKKIVTWYAHGYVGWKLYLVNWLTDKILTSSDKGCRLKNRKKIEVIGQGIDIDYFRKHDVKNKSKEKFKIVSVGRISPAKDYETLIEAIGVLVKKKGIKNLEIEIIGQPVLKRDYKYLVSLKHLIKDKGLEEYIGIGRYVAQSIILNEYLNSDLVVNLGQTGSMDKVVLEAMACEKLVLTCNEAFIDFFDDQRLIFRKKNPQDLAQKIINLINLSLEEKENTGRRLRDKVVKNHNLDNLAKKIVSFYEK